MAKRASKAAANKARGAKSRGKAAAAPAPRLAPGQREDLVVITGLSGSGKATVLRVFEDLGFYCVDNLPVTLMPQFVELVKQSLQIDRAALVVDIREGEQLGGFPAMLRDIKQQLATTIIFVEASDDAIIRRFSETRRPHPLGQQTPVKLSVKDERKRLEPIRNMADMVIDTSTFNVHELRAHVMEKFRHDAPEKTFLVSCQSFGYKHGVPPDSDLLFDVRFLPNPHFIPEFRPFTGRDPKVAKYIRSFPQTEEFIQRISALLVYLLPHYVKEGKSYLTVGFGCTGGQHRSVMIAEDVAKQISQAGYRVNVIHRDSQA